jgi:nitrogenase molybdenum-iron protein alpha/beta subunit
LLTESGRQDKTTQIAAYMYAIVNANSIVMEETMKVKQKRKTFNQIVEEAGLTAEWEARGEARGEARFQQEREKLQAEIANLRKQLEGKKK